MGRIICQAIRNELQLYDFPNELKSVRSLEKVLIARKLLFKKITVLPKGQSPKMQFCNIPVDVLDVCNTMSCAAGSSGLAIAKLKQRLEYAGHVFLESVHPKFMRRLLFYSKMKNSI